MTVYYWLSVYTLLLLVGFIGYWTRRIEQRHRTKIAAIDSAGAASAAAFEQLKHQWADEDRARRQEHDAFMAQIRSEILDRSPSQLGSAAAAAP